MNIVTLLRRVAGRDSSRLALAHGDSTMTYGQLYEKAARFAAFLVDHDLQPGQRVGLFMHNQPEWIVSLLGIWQAGGVAVPFNYLFHPSALRHAAQDSDIRWMVTTAGDVDRVHESVHGTVAADRIISVGAATGARVAFSEALTTVAPLDYVVPRMDGDDALLMYTSGSTGKPKGVRQSHRNTAAIAEAETDCWSLTEDDHALISTPLFHVGGLQLLAVPLLAAGGTITLRRWNVQEWLRDAVRLRPTVVALVPAMMFDIINALEDEHLLLDSIRVCAIGGSALPQTKLAELTNATGIVPVNIYGQTEQSGVSILQPLGESRCEGSLGKPLSQVVEIRIVADTQNREAAPGEVGELWVRGDTVSPGYWCLPAANSARFTADGWLRTNDLVRRDTVGNLYFVDRADDMIISGGENIYPQMVECHLIECPHIREVAVIGTPHDRYGQQVTAVIVPTSPSVTVDEVTAFCAQNPNLQGLQRPRRIEIVEELPRTATNKVDRPKLKATLTQ